MKARLLVLLMLNFTIFYCSSQNLSEGKIKKELGDYYDCYLKNKNSSTRQFASYTAADLLSVTSKLGSLLDVLYSDERYDVILFDTTGMQQKNRKMYLELKSIENQSGKLTNDIAMIRDYKKICEYKNEINELWNKTNSLWAEMQPIRKIIDAEQGQKIAEDRKKMEEDYRKGEELKKKKDAEEEAKYNDWKAKTHFEIPYEITLFTNDNECQYCYKTCVSHQFRWPTIDFSSYSNVTYMTRLFSEEKSAYVLLFKIKYGDECPKKQCKESRSGEHAWKTLNKTETVSKMKFKN